MTHRHLRRWIVLPLACASTLGAQQATTDNRTAIRADDIRRDLFEMAGDAFRGREAGTPEFVADVVKQAGAVENLIVLLPKPYGDLT